MFSYLPIYQQKVLFEGCRNVSFLIENVTQSAPIYNNVFHIEQRERVFMYNFALDCASKRRIDLNRRENKTKTIG